MTPSLLYLYGLVRAGVDTSAIDGVEEDSVVTVIEDEDLACAVTTVPAASYERRVDGSNAEDLAWLTPRVWRHHQALRELHARDAVVPFKFGTLCPTADDARRMVARLRGSAKELLPRVAGKDEWTLRMTADESAVSEHARGRETDLIALQQEVELLPAGRAYFARKRLQQATAECVATYLEEIEAAVSGRLAALGAEVAHTPRPRRGDRRETVTETAVLLPPALFRELEARVQQVEAEHASRVRFELVGPWPPYSFASISQATPPEYDSQRPL